MSTDEAVTFNLELNVEPALSSMRQIEGLAYRTLGYMRRLGLPEDLNNAIGTIQNITMAIRMMHTALIAIEMASGPVGWFRAGLAIVGAGFAVGSAAQEYTALRCNS